MSIIDRIRNAWNAFRNRDPTLEYNNTGSSFGRNPWRTQMYPSNERSIVAAIYNRIALDVAAIDIKHVKVDKNGRYQETVEDELNYCFTTEANMDQTSRAFIQDVVLSLFDEGYIAILPVETEVDPNVNGSFKIYTMRVAKIIEWKPNAVKLRAYNDISGKLEDLWMYKHAVAIIENPFYAVMNQYNSTVKRLLRKLTLIDAVDEETTSGKWNMIVQVPYTTKTQIQKDRAEQRRKNVEEQLEKSKYGVAYIDGTEHIIQLNRPIESGLMDQIQYLNDLMFSQLCITQEILNGTADEKTMANYYSRTVKPVVSAIVEECKRKFLTKTARTQRHSLMYFNNPFNLCPVSDLAEMSDKFTRNEVMSTNEVRSLLGMLPSKDPRADELLNKNINHPNEGEEKKPREEEFQNGDKDDS